MSGDYLHLPGKVAFFCLLSLTVFSQDPYSIVTDGIFSPVSTTGATSINIGDEEMGGPLPIGFSFFFFGNLFEQFYISDNGFITFGDNQETGCCAGQLLPDPAIPNNLIAFAWEDLDPSVQGAVSYQTLGVAPSRKLVVSFEDILHYGDDLGQYPVTSQVILYEGTDIIEIHTTQMASNGGIHTMGIENADGTVAYAVSGRNAADWSVNNDFVQFVPVLSPSVDAGLTGLLPAQFQEGPNVLRAKVTNYGLQPLAGLEFQWMINDTLKEPTYWTGNLARGYSDTVSLGTVNLELGNTYNLKVWVTAAADGNAFNDTLFIAGFSPFLRSEYTIGPGQDFTTISEAVSILSEGMVSDSVKFLLAPGTYNEQVEIDQSAHSSCNARVIFESSTSDPADVIWTFAASSDADNYTVWLNGADGITFRNLTIEAAGTTYARVIQLSNGASCNQFEKNIIQGPIISGTGTGGSTNKELVYSPSDGDPLADPNNIFSGNHLIGGSWGLYWGAIYAEKETGNRIVGNHFDRQAIRAIEGRYQEGFIIKDNLIEGSETTSYTYSGILLLSCSRLLQITNNRMFIPKGDKGIYLRNCLGLSAAGYQGIIANNFILINQGSGTTIRGILVDLNSQHQYFYYNTVNILGSSSTAAAFSLVQSANVKALNNIWSNQAGGYAAYMSGSTFEASHNCLYTTGNYLAYLNGSNHADLSSWQTASGQDDASLSVDPLFISSTDYHVSEIALNEAGEPIPGITQDLDGEPRDAQFPDIGADEFTPDIGADAGITGILNPSFPFPAGNHSVEVVIRNFGTETLSQATIAASINDSPPVWHAWTGNLASGETDTLSFGDFVFELEHTYQIVAWTESPNGTTDARTDNDTTTVTGLRPAMSGIYTIGGSNPDFINFTTAVARLHANGIMDEVIFKIRNGTYLEQLAFQAFPRNTENARVVFESEAQDSSVVTLTFEASSEADNYTILLDGASGLIFRHMTIEAQGSEYGQAIVLQKGATYNEFSHNLIKSYSHPPLSNSAVGGILAKGDPSLPHHHNILRNNRIQGGNFGISYARGGSLYGEISPCVEIMDNLLTGQQKAPLEVFLNKTSDGFIERNEIQFVQGMPGTYRGISLSGGVGSRISKNKVQLFYTGDPNSATLTGVELNNEYNIPDSWGISQISNNMISVEAEGQAVTGMEVSGEQIALSYNSVWVNSSLGRALFADGSGEERIYNNIFYNQSNGYVFAMTAVPTEPMSDHNDFFTPSGDLCIIGFGPAASIISTLEEWQFQSGQDAHSLFADPDFTEAPLDLHVQADALNDAGVPVAEVMDDFDGEPRDPILPDIGADEFIPSWSYNAGVLAMNAPVAPFPAGSNSVVITLRNAGQETLSIIPIAWEVNGIRQPNAEWTGSLAIGDTAHFTLGAYGFIPTVAHDLKIWTALAGDAQTDNDTIWISNVYAALDGDYTIGGSNPDFPDFTDAATVLRYGGVLGFTQLLARPGIYDEQISLPSIPGASADNAVVFGVETPDGPEVNLTFYADDPQANYTVQLDGASHVTFRDLRLQSRSVHYGRIIDLRSGASSNHFVRNQLLGIQVLESSDSLALVFGADELSPPGHFNEFLNNTFEGGSYGLYLNPGDWNHALHDMAIDSNHFTNQYQGAISLTYALSPSILRNTIANADHAHADYEGIALRYGVDGFLISLNKVVLVKGKYGVLLDVCSPNENDTEDNWGLLINNFVQLPSGPENAALKLTNSHHQGIYFNSVHLSGSPETSSRAFEIDNNSGLEIRNNIFANSAGGYAIYAPEAYSRFTSDYNCFYSNGQNLAYRTQPLQDLSAWQINTSQDNTSIAEDPVFLGDQDLHARGPLLDGRGTPVAGIAIDIDGEGRDPIHPDIGADEFTPILGADAGLPKLLSPTAVPSGIGSREVRVVLRNYGVDDLTSTNVILSVNEQIVKQYPWTGLLGTGDRDTLSIDTLDFALGNFYDLKLWVENINGAADPWAPNDTIFLGDLHPYMAGVYTIGGTSPDFHQIGGAIDTLHAMGIVDSVFFHIRNGTYREQLALHPFEGNDRYLPVIFESESEDSTAVVIEYEAMGPEDNYVLRLDSLEGIVFRNLSFHSLSSEFGRILELNSLSDRVEFSSNIFNVADNNMDSEAIFGLGGNVNDYLGILFSNNLIQGGRKGIVYAGQDLNTLVNNIRILNNTFSGQFLGAIQLKWATNPHIEENRIIAPLADIAFTAISLEYTRDFDINKNNITIYNSGRGIFLNECSRNTGIGALFPPLISNNFIYIGGKNTSGGIVIWNSPAVQVFFNNVHMAAFESVALFTSSDDNFYVPEEDKLDILNNNLINSGYGIALQISPDLSYVRNVDYNNLLTNGDVLTVQGASLTYATLQAWQAASGLDQNSLSADPYFLRPDDLHVQQILLNEAALDIDYTISNHSVYDDIDGEFRDSQFPDLGADEFTPSNYDLRVSAVLSPKYGCALSAEEPVKIVVQNVGLQPAPSFEAGFILDNLPAVLSGAITKELSSGDTAVILFDQSLDLDDLLAHQIKAFCMYGMDENPINDTLSVDLPPFPPMYLSLTPDTSICLDEYVRITAEVNLPAFFRWAHGERENTFWATPEADTTYYVEVINTYGCSLTDSVHVQVNVPIVPVILSEQDMACAGETIELSVEPPGELLWSTEDTTTALMVEQSGLYSVTRTDENGCSETSEELEITILPPPVIEVQGYLPLCRGDTLNLMATEATQFLWSTGETEAVIRVAPQDTTTYTLIAGNDFGCVDTLSVMIPVIPVAPPPAPQNLLPLDSTFELSLPLIFSWEGSPLSSRYDIYAWPEGEPAPEIPILSDLTQVNYHLTSDNNPYPYFRYGTTYRWWVVAKNSCFSTPSDTQVFSLRHLPDLVIDTIETPVEAYSGQSLTLSWVVKNIEEGRTPDGRRWYDGVYLSEDTIYNTGAGSLLDNLLATFQNVSALQPGESYRQTREVIMPESVSGFRYLFVVPDQGQSVIKETDEENNRLRYAQIPVILTPPPDLQVTSVLSMASAFSGEPLELNWTVTNKGESPTRVGRWFDYIYLSGNPSFDPDQAFYLGNLQYKGGLLDADSSYTQTRTVTLPEGISGTFYLFVVTDKPDQVYESPFDENNAGRSAPIEIILKPPPDLSISNLQVPDIISGGADLSIQYTIVNQGGSTIEKRWQDWIFLATKRAYGARKKWLVNIVPHNQDLPPGGSIQQPVTFFIPDTMAGPYDLIIQLDYGDEIYEYVYEDNNLLEIPIEVSTPDLIVTRVTIPDTAWSGQIMPIEYVVKNNGAGHLIKRKFHDHILLHSDPVCYLPTARHVEQPVRLETLYAGDSVVVSTAIELPEGITGAYFVSVYTDYPLLLPEDVEGILEEPSEDNNLGRSDTTLWIWLSPWWDLEPIAFEAPDTVIAGGEAAFQFSVRNNGPGPVDTIAWTDKIIYIPLPGDPTLYATVASVRHYQFVAADSIYQVQIAGRIPCPLNEGMDELEVFVDADEYENLYEYTQENNNRLSSGPVYFRYPAVDLVVTPRSVPDTVLSSRTVNVKLQVSNTGEPETACLRAWSDRLYLSKDTLIDPSDQIIRWIKINQEVPDKIPALHTYMAVPLLATGESYTISESFEAPDGLSGRYYLIVQADYTGVHSDPDQTNNTLVYPIEILFAEPPDLLPVSLTAPEEIYAGLKMPYSWTIKNQGTGEAYPSKWVDRVYLSRDFVVDARDRVLGQLEKNGGLLPGQSYTKKADLFIPASYSGNYLLLLVADDQDTVYEHHGEDNNVLAVPVVINPLPPVDLIVLDISTPEEVLLGETGAIQWETQNIGENPPRLNYIDVVYLSLDTLLDEGDHLFGSLAQNQRYDPGVIVHRSLTGVFQGLLPGDYYVLVRTDAQNLIPETDETNNQLASLNTIRLTVEELYLDIPVSKALPHGQSLIYRLELPDSLATESLLLEMDADSITTFNELYLAYDRIASRVNHDFSAKEPFVGHQEIVAPSISTGTYYMDAYGNSTIEATQDARLLATILPFELRKYNPQKGGNIGTVTIQLSGSKFDPGMIVVLQNTQDTLTANELIYVEPTRAFARFDLSGMAAGWFDFYLQNSVGDTFVWSAAFEVIEGGAGELFFNAIYRNTTPPRRIVPITVEFANGGSTDLINPQAQVRAITDVPLALAPEELSRKQKELIVPLREFQGPEGILRAGARGTITVYVQAMTDIYLVLEEYTP